MKSPAVFDDIESSPCWKLRQFAVRQRGNPEDPQQ